MKRVSNGRLKCAYETEEASSFLRLKRTRGGVSSGQDYFTHESANAFDLRRDGAPRCGANCSALAWDDRGAYSTHLFTAEAVAIVAAHDANATSDAASASARRPLFLELAYQAVHSPAEVPMESRARLCHARSCNAMQWHATMMVRSPAE
jgi:hypothetical protein